MQVGERTFVGAVLIAGGLALAAFLTDFAGLGRAGLLTVGLGGSGAPLVGVGLWVPLASLALVWVFAWLAWSERIRPRSVCLLAPAVAACVALALGTTKREGLFEIPRSVYAQGYLSDAGEFSGPLDVWRSYEEHAERLSPHGQTHPPGPVFVNALVLSAARALRAPCARLGIGSDLSGPDVREFALAGNLAGYLLILLQAAWLLPLYGFTRAAYGERAAAAATILGSVAPSTTLVAPMIDAVFPLVSAAIALTFWRGVNTGHRGQLLLAGALVGAGLAFSISFAVVLGVLAGILLLRALAAPRALLELGHALPLFAGLFLVYVAAIGLGAEPIERVRAILGYHYAGVNAVRPYVRYLFLSPYAFFLGLSVPIAIGFAGALGDVQGRTRRARDPIAWSVLAVLVALTLAGTTRGETDRLWLALAPFVFAPGAAFLARRLPSSPALLAVVTLVFATTLAMRA